MSKHNIHTIVQVDRDKRTKAFILATGPNPADAIVTISTTFGEPVFTDEELGYALAAMRRSLETAEVLPPPLELTTDCAMAALMINALILREFFRQGGDTCVSS